MLTFEPICLSFQNAIIISAFALLGVAYILETISKQIRDAVKPYAKEEPTDEDNTENGIPKTKHN
jgi:hypothetical protein